ncbi:hypothetical protein [Streptomyces nodosus]|uniref:Uncharacterized protein n=1 Tax=Streptomyces nodosus TaxID=40318 RepID=A0A0B5DKW1_9ACTN|nr:hypothetical protein [Streptomyces nodosus]AJE43804.1 hypothetical protein SNOD_30230 [Streptomyces nodosus]MBB4795344.1 hypothetical protein [Streptomyces nodosus]QEV42308.1 hypothetical protein CP978_30535 [Streptomyces nodosus]
MSARIRTLGVSLAICGTVLAGTAAGPGADVAQAAGKAAVAQQTDSSLTASASSVTTAEHQRFAKTRFVINAGLAAGATYEWIIKPWKAGAFKKGAHGRTSSLIKAGLAGAFAYNRLRAAQHNAQGDPTLSRAMAPLNSGINDLKHLPSKLRSGDTSAASSFDNVINQVKDAGHSAGAPVKNRVPSWEQLISGAHGAH